MPLTLLLFHNCGKFRSATTKGGLSSLGCINNIKPVFKTSMHAFFNAHNCIQCHQDGGVSGKPFASANVDTAFQVFLAYGSDRVKNKLSLGGGHSGNNYNTDNALKANLDTAKSAWDSAVDGLNCSDSAIKTSPKSIAFYNPAPDQFGIYRVKHSGTAPNIVYDIAPANGPQTLMWDLKPGLTIEFKIQVFADGFAKATHYIVSEVKAKSNTPYKLSNLKVYLNNETYDVTTFEGVDITTPGGGTLVPIYVGANAVFEKNEGEIYTNTDAWTLSVDVGAPGEEEE